ncbi:alpha/beta hydrolase family protein [Deinococcus roseus]|uniref:alpha/beta hydrolase family protein n=1 Tax=Deinococcus roseus TaxID=392414 RepID=UPI00166672F0|nr:dienelactone hydrolase [Deinococcus roseus]
MSISADQKSAGPEANPKTANLKIPGNRIDTLRPDAPELAQPGPWDVGVQTLHLMDPWRPDVVNSTSELQFSPRNLTLEVWYPAQLSAGQERGEAYHTVLRDGKTPIVLHGKAVREAQPAAEMFPLVILTHGYPGNRFLMAHLGENLASKGHVVVSIDHTDSTYSDLSVFSSTLYNRPLDQLFVLQEITRLGEQGSLFSNLADTDRVALIGYSMGGYGVLNNLGAGFSDAAVFSPVAPPFELLKQRAHSNPEYPASLDRRIKAAMAIAPWGMNYGLWEQQAFASIQTPLFLMGGTLDEVAGYENGARAIYQNAINTTRHLLTFENANHNVAAPMPAPLEAWADPEDFRHYADPVWDTVRMNNILQHFATAFLALHLKGDQEMAAYLDASFKGFKESGKAGLKLE